MTANPLRRGLLACAGLGLLASGPVRAITPNAFTVAAASDLKFALEEVVEEFVRSGGARPRLVFGSSGNFYSQILQGAPFHVFMSADEAFVFKLAQAGKAMDQGRLYAYGRIGILVPRQGRVAADPELRDLRAALHDGRLSKFSIANPAHAPYGMRAQEALERVGLWERIRPFLVYGENVSQAAQFALSGSAQGGIVAYSLARAPEISARGDFALIAQTWHQPLAQRVVVLRQAPVAAVQFYDYLRSPAAQQIMMRFGFEIPGSLR